MFPDSVERKEDISTNADKEEPADFHQSDVKPKEKSVGAEPHSNQVTKLETDKTENSEEQNNECTQPTDREAEDVAIDNDQNDSGEFVVTMLAKAKLEEQGIGVKGRSSPLMEAGNQESPAFMSHRDEDVTADSWRQHRKHVFVLSEAGKPIYSRYGSEEALSSTMGVMMALVSFVQSGDNIIRSVYSGKSISVFVVCVFYVSYIAFIKKMLSFHGICLTHNETFSVSDLVSSVGLLKRLVSRKWLVNVTLVGLTCH